MRPTNVTVRRGGIEHAPACSAICYAAFEDVARRHGFPPDTPSLESAVALVSSLLARSDVYAMVAEGDGLRLYRIPD